MIHLDRQLAGDLTVAKDLDGITGAIDQVLFPQSGFSHGVSVIESLFEAAQVDDFKLRLESGVGETFLGKTTEQRHLTAFEARPNAGASAGFLTLVPFAGSLAVAGTFTAADAFATLHSSAIGFQIVQSHGGYLIKSWG